MCTAEQFLTPRPPSGYVACRSTADFITQTTHLVEWAPHAEVHPPWAVTGETLCGLTRFPRKVDGVMVAADLPEWGVSSTYGPGVRQVKCQRCWAAVKAPARTVRTADAPPIDSAPNPKFVDAILKFDQEHAADITAVMVGEDDLEAVRALVQAKLDDLMMVTVTGVFVQVAFRDNR